MKLRAPVNASAIAAPRRELRGMRSQFSAKGEKTLTRTMNTTKCDIEYPCRWTYKIIGQDEAMLREAVTGVLAESRYTITPSNRSRTGKYLCLNIETEVHDEARRIEIYEALRHNSVITMVL